MSGNDVLSLLDSVDGQVELLAFPPEDVLCRAIEQPDEHCVHGSLNGKLYLSLCLGVRSGCRKTVH